MDKKDYLKKLNWMPIGRMKKARPKARWKEDVLRAM
jgi:hypothetical protein